MPLRNPPRFKKTLLAIAAGAVLAPYSAWALDLSTGPPGSVEPYVRPNVVISFDDSGSMKYWVDATTSGTADGVARTAPVAGTWPIDTQRISVLKYAVNQVFSDTNFLPDKKIRLAWQTMHNNGNASGAGKNMFPGANNVNTAGKHNMRILDQTHRQNFIDFVGWMLPNNGTPTHKMAYQAHNYMTANLSKDGPWASDPGKTAAPYLGCRRNYHILMSDGGWQTAPSGVEKPGNADGATFVLPDGVPYKAVWPYADTRTDMVADWAFKSWATELQQGNADPTGTTGLKGKVEPTADYRKAASQENFGKDKSGKDAILDRYWNPRYNPASWPHMVTYTIGFSKAATTWSGEPNIKRPPDTTTAPFTQNIVPFSYDAGINGSLPDFITGNIIWPNLTTATERTKNPLDLWHAALNGRGRYYAVENGNDLEKAFREIFGQINVATDPDLSASATSGSNVSRSEVGKYTSSYEPLKAWKGAITADRVKTDGTTVPDPAWGGKTTADGIDAASVASRLVLSWSDKWDTTKPKGGVPFKWSSDESNLSAAQKLWLQKGVTTTTGITQGQERLDYIRGERSKEGSEVSGYTPTKPYRERQSRQGDIINSDVWYVGAPAGNSLLKGYAAFARANKSRPGMLYVGGNDGMLHGFAASESAIGAKDGGIEKIAYVPRGVIPSLALLTEPAYNNSHKYFVDGSPMTGDVDLNGGMQDPADPNYAAYTPDWRTLLVGTLGLGGKGYFVLDVTNPTASGSLSFGEGNASTLVKLDRTRGGSEPAPNCSAFTGAEKTACEKAVDEDKDIGFIVAKPVLDDNDAMRTTQITRMSNNRWAVVTGNGYNSTNQRPVLLIQYLDGGRELVRIPVTAETPGTGNAADNGLAAPRVVDVNGDGRIDIAYAGDNRGNLWKFDLTSATPGDWKVAFGGSPLFTAR
ncbi:MAG: pilus assembly protein PilC, partial [Burkholderiaceae bacterium]|nr:pilus assembly protein PilC [Burkholderiaceae bacterium]